MSRTRRLPANTNEVVSRRWRASMPLLVAGGGSVVVGGLTAAVTGPTGWEHGSWMAAFLVLVAGVAQVGIGLGQAHLVGAPVTVCFADAECVLWNVGCLLVITGTLLASPVAVSIGTAPLVVTLAMSTVAVRRFEHQPRVVLVYRALLILLLISIPVGVALAWTGH